MIPKMRNKAFKWAVASLAIALLAGCSSYSNKPSSSQNHKSTPTENPQTSNGTPSTGSSSQTSSSIIEYKNKQYGFSFTLPADWKGYSIVTSQWEGLAQKQTVETVIETGPLISNQRSEMDFSDSSAGHPDYGIYTESMGFIAKRRYSI